MLPPLFKKYTTGVLDLSYKGNTVGEVLASLSEDNEKLSNFLMNENGELRSFIKIYVGDEDINYLEGSLTPVNDHSKISIVIASAGG